MPRNKKKTGSIFSSIAIGLLFICYIFTLFYLHHLVHHVNHKLTFIISAAGLQGLQPLLSQTHVGKGSRQARSVTSGKGLALRAELCRALALSSTK